MTHDDLLLFFGLLLLGGKEETLLWWSLLFHYIYIYFQGKRSGKLSTPLSPSSPLPPSPSHPVCMGPASYEGEWAKGTVAQYL